MAHGSLQDNKEALDTYPVSAYAPCPEKLALTTRCLFNSKAAGYSNQGVRRLFWGRIDSGCPKLRGCGAYLSPTCCRYMKKWCGCFALFFPTSFHGVLLKGTSLRCVGKCPE
jgi:hypothetical protein